LRSAIFSGTGPNSHLILALKIEGIHGRLLLLFLVVLLPLFLVLLLLLFPLQHPVQELRLMLWAPLLSAPPPRLPLILLLVWALSLLLRHPANTPELTGTRTAEVRVAIHRCSRMESLVNSLAVLLLVLRVVLLLLVVLLLVLLVLLLVLLVLLLVLLLLEVVLLILLLVPLLLLLAAVTMVMLVSLYLHRRLLLPSHLWLMALFQADHRAGKSSRGLQCAGRDLLLQTPH
jgi:hypothetical protein